MSIRNMLEELGGKLRKTGKSRTRKYLLVALCVLLSLNMVLAVVPGAVFADEQTVSSMKELLLAIDNAERYGAETVIEISGDFELYDTITVDSYKSITLVPASGSAVISRGSSFTGSLFEISGEGSCLTLESGIIVDGSKSYVDAYAPLVSVSDYGCFVLDGGTLQNNYSYDNGGAIHASDKASVTVIDGSITGNESYNKGGAVYLENSVWLMYGGSVGSNYAYIGAGICAEDSSFYTYSGSINDNIAGYKGGGAYLSGCSKFVLGSDEADKAVAVRGNIAPVGAGIYLCNRPFESGADSVADVKNYSITGNVVVKDNITEIYSPKALPENDDNQCNLLLETADIAPCVYSLDETDSDIGLYPLQHGTVVTSNRDYYGDELTFDHDAAYLDGYTTHTSDGITIKETPTVQILSSDMTNGSAVADLGDWYELEGGLYTYAGFPVHLTVKPDSGYILDINDETYDDEFNVISYSGTETVNVKNGTGLDGLWHTFFDSSEQVLAKYTAADAVASVNGMSYETLDEALRACWGERDSVVTLLPGDPASTETVWTIYSDFYFTVPSGEHITIKSADNSKPYSIKRVDPSFSVFDVDKSAVLTLDGITLDGNGEIEDAASLVCVYGGTLEMTNGASIINANGFNGGAVYLQDGVLDMSAGGTLKGNSAENGGAVYMTGDSLLIGDGDSTTCEIEANQFTGMGGGVYMDGGVISGCDISLNKPAVGASGTMGGGVYMTSGSIVDSSIGATVSSGVSNSAATGAGIYALTGNLENVTVSNNMASSAAGGVYYDKGLDLSGKIVISGNKLDGSASNLLVNSAAPVKVNGLLAADSSVGVTAAAADIVVGKCDSEADASENYSLFASDSTSGVRLGAQGGDIVTVDADKALTVTIAKEKDSLDFTSTPAVGTSVVMGENGSFRLYVDYSHRLSLGTTVYDASGKELDDALAINGPFMENGDQIDTLFYYEVTPMDYTPGSSVTLAINIESLYSQGYLYSEVVMTDRERLIVYNDGSYRKADIYIVYGSVLMSPYTDQLNAEYFEWGGKDNRTAQNEMSKAKEATTDYFDGYIRLEPVVNSSAPAGTTALGSKSDAPEVTIKFNVGTYADDADAIDIVTYNGVESYTEDGETAGGAVLHKDVPVDEGGMVEIDVERGNGDTADIIYVAVVNHRNNVAAIDDVKYATLAEAFADAENGDEIVLLSDTVLRESVVVPDGMKLALSAESPLCISRGGANVGALFFVEDGGELELENIILDGGADVTSFNPMKNEGMNSSASLVANHGTFTANNISFINNDVYYYGERGGALYNGATGEANVKNAVFEGNIAGFGGAICNDNKLELQDCVVCGNCAEYSGGAIQSNGSLTLTDTAITENRCLDDAAGGVYVSGGLDIAGNVCITSNTDKRGATSNLWNDSADPIVITDDLDLSAMIGIAHPDEEGVIIAEGDGKDVRDASDYYVNFFPDIVDTAIVGESKVVAFDTKDEDYVTVILGSGENGSVSPCGSVRVPEGGALTITAVPDASYAVAELLVDEKSVLASAEADEKSGIVTYELKDIEDDTVVAAAFKKAPGSTIKPSASVGGSISPSTNVCVNSEETTEFTITPTAGTGYSGYYLESLKLGGKDVLNDAVKNSDGTYTYSVTGVTDKEIDLKASFQPIYSNRTLTDSASGVEINGYIHYQAYLSVKQLADNYPNLYNQMVQSLTNTSSITQYITQAYDISLCFEDEVAMESVEEYDKTRPLTIFFNLGSSYNGKTVRVFHTVGSTVDTNTHIIPSVPDDGVISITPNSLSPYAVVVQEEVKSSAGTGTGSGSGSGSGTGTGNGSSTDNGKGPVSGDYSQPRTVPPIVIVLIVLSSATIIFIVGKFYMPKLMATLRRRYGMR